MSLVFIVVPAFVAVVALRDGDGGRQNSISIFNRQSRRLGFLPTPIMISQVHPSSIEKYSYIMEDTGAMTLQDSASLAQLLLDFFFLRTDSSIGSYN